MKVRDVMCEDVVTCNKGDRLDVPARLMWDHDCGIVPVLDDAGRVVGLVTDRDICMAALMQGLPLEQIPVTSAMSRQVHACTASEPLEAIEAVMRERQVRRVPVLDDGAMLVGIVSLNDLALAARDGKDGRPTAVSAPSVARTLGCVSEPHATADDRAPATGTQASRVAASKSTGNAASAGTSGAAGATSSPGGSKRPFSATNAATGRSTDHGGKQAPPSRAGGKQSGAAS